MFDSPPENPLSVGDIVDAAIRAIRKNPLEVARLMLVPTVISMFGAIFLQWAFSFDLPDLIKTRDVALAGRMVLFTFVGAIAAIVGGVMQVQRQLALVRTVTGFAPDLQAAVKTMQARTLALVGMVLLSVAMFFGLCFFIGLWIGVSLALTKSGLPLAVVGIIGATVGVWGFVILVFFWWLQLMVAMCVFACEDGTVGDAITRGFKLAASGGNIVRGLGFALLLFGVIYAINIPLSTPIVALTLTDMFKQGLAHPNFSDDYKPPLWILIISQVWESGVHLLLKPALLCAFGYFYLDLRMRAEGLDIRRRLVRFVAGKE